MPAAPCELLLPPASSRPSLLIMLTCPVAAPTTEVSRARHQLVRDGKPVQAGAWGGAQQAEADGTAYLQDVRERQRQMAAEASTARAQVSWRGRGAGGMPLCRCGMVQGPE